MTANLDSYLRTHRRRSGLTQDELGSLLGHQSGAVISVLERSGRALRLREAYAFEIIFGITAHELFPHIHTSVLAEVIARVRERYDELQGDSSLNTRLKLDFFESIFERVEAQLQGL